MLAAALLAVAQVPPPAVWYGPQTVTFNIQVTGNPYDPAENDLKVRFMPEKGAATERIAYVAEDGTIRATLVSQTPGRYRAVLVRNGKDLLEPSQEGIFELVTKLPDGFIRVDPNHPNRFMWDDGKPYYPVGFNLGWQGEGVIPMTDQISKMASAGINWTRIWATNWDGKNPWWPTDDPKANPKQLWPKALAKWDEIETACDQVHLPFQFVLFHHGLFSSKVNPNWPDHPWNAAKGGFLKDAADFFTDPEAKRRTKMWLRYAVARYGHSPNLLAWELFNEVEWVDARYADRWSDIAAWHKEMSDYLRSIDPYKHLITTSSATDQKEMYAAMDYYQPHTYPPNVLMAVAGNRGPGDKPWFFGEFGPPDGTDEQTAEGIRDGIYGAMLKNEAGAAEYWFWDNVEKKNLYPIFETAALVRDASEIAIHPAARPLDLVLSTEGTATMAFGPGQGWGKTSVTSLSLPEDANPEKLGGLSGYLQNPAGANKDLFPAPLTMHFNAKLPGVFRISVGEIAAAGGSLKISVNGKEVGGKAWPAGTKIDHEIIEVPFGSGANDLKVESTGPDWVRVNGFEFTNIGPQATAMGLGSADWAMVRLREAPGIDGAKVTLGAMSLPDGTYHLTVIDLLTGKKTQSDQTISNFTLKDYQMPGPDLMLIFKRQDAASGKG